MEFLVGQRTSLEKCGHCLFYRLPKAPIIRDHISAIREFLPFLLHKFCPSRTVLFDPWLAGTDNLMVYKVRPNGERFHHSPALLPTIKLPGLLKLGYHFISLCTCQVRSPASILDWTIE